MGVSNVKIWPWLILRTRSNDNNECVGNISNQENNIDTNQISETRSTKNSQSNTLTSTAASYHSLSVAGHASNTSNSGDERKCHKLVQQYVNNKQLVFVCRCDSAYREEIMTRLWYAFPQALKAGIEKNPKRMKQAFQTKEKNNKALFQVTTWKDKTQVMLVYTHMAEKFNKNSTVKRFTKGSSIRKDIKSPQVVKDYLLNMNAVDKTDHDGRDNSITIQTNPGMYKFIFGKLIKSYMAFTSQYVSLHSLG